MEQRVQQETRQFVQGTQDMVLARGSANCAFCLYLIWNALKAISAESLIAEGRVYGGGLHKIEPKELAKRPAGNIISLIANYGMGR